jgi:hypothetical protein
MQTPSRLRPGEGADQPPGRLGHLVDGLVERGLVAPGWGAVPTHLADELEGRLPDLDLGRGDVALSESLDTSAHGRDATGHGIECPGGARITDAAIIDNVLWVSSQTELTEVELASPDLDQHVFDVPEGISAGSVAPAPDGSRVWVGNCGCPIEN